MRCLPFLLRSSREKLRGSCCEGAALRDHRSSCRSCILVLHVQSGGSRFHWNTGVSLAIILPIPARAVARLQSQLPSHFCSVTKSVRNELMLPQAPKWGVARPGRAMLGGAHLRGSGRSVESRESAEPPFIRPS